MLLRKIESLRKEPKEVRKRFALYVSLLCTAVIALGWGLSLPQKFAAIPEIEIDTTVPEDDAGGFARAIDDMRSQFATAIEGVGPLSEAVSGSSSTATNTIDIAAMFAATGTPSTTASPTISPSPRTVLIATTSAETSQ